MQALEVFSKKEKEGTLKGFSKQELYDYSRVCDGYSQLLLKWEKREPLGEKYQQRVLEIISLMNEETDWMFPLTTHFWTPTLFDWGKSLLIVCLNYEKSSIWHKQGNLLIMSLCLKSLGLISLFPLYIHFCIKGIPYDDSSWFFFSS